MRAVSIRPMGNVGRPKKAEHERVRNAGFAALPSEVAAIKSAATKLRFRTGFDYVRRLVIDAGHPATRGKIGSPRSR